MDGECPASNGCGVSSAWKSDNWVSADNILTNGPIDRDNAVDLILNTYKASTGSLGNLYGFTDDDVRAFLTADSYHKNIDIAEITKYVELNCLDANNGANNLIDEFDRCFAEKNTVEIKDFHENLYPKPPANFDYYPLRGGPVILVNVADKVDSDKYERSEFYEYGAQNIYAEYPKLNATRLPKNVYKTDSCERPGTEGAKEGEFIQCEVQASGVQNGGLGYTNDKPQRNNWVLSGGFLRLVFKMHIWSSPIQIIFFVSAAPYKNATLINLNSEMLHSDLFSTCDDIILKLFKAYQPIIIPVVLSVLSLTGSDPLTAQLKWHGKRTPALFVLALFLPKTILA